MMGCYYSVDSSAPTILQSRVRTPNTPSTLLYSAKFVIALNKRTKIDKKRLDLANKKTNFYCDDCDLELSLGVLYPLACFHVNAEILIRVT